LDGNARLNVATFVTTWMEPQAQRLMAEWVDKNMIDKDEYPQTAELESRCVAMLSRLWHAPQAAGGGGWPQAGGGCGVPPRRRGGRVARRPGRVRRRCWGGWPSSAAGSVGGPPRGRRRGG